MVNLELSYLCGVIAMLIWESLFNKDGTIFIIDYTARSLAWLTKISVVCYQVTAYS